MVFVPLRWFRGVVMADLRHRTPVSWLVDVDCSVCVLCNRANHWRAVRMLFAAVSWLGDGIFWVVLGGLLLAVEGRGALGLAVEMAGVGAVCYVLYALLKRKTTRERPFVAHPEAIFHTANPLDQYSFPSGHTMQAVALSIVIVASFPLLAYVLVPFAVLVALSRVVVGLHYPSDVLAGVVLGALVGAASVCL